MVQDFVKHLKAVLDGLFFNSNTVRNNDTGKTPGNRGQDKDDHNLREHELLFWSAAHGLWY